MQLISNIVLLLLGVGPLYGQASGNGSTPQTQPLTVERVVDGWQPSDGILRALIEVGVQNHLPLAVLLDDDSLCVPRQPATNSSLTLKELQRQVQTEVPTYRVEIEANMVSVRPAELTQEMRDVLSLRIPRFKTQPTSAEELGIDLWMNIRAVLVPSQGSAFIGGIQKGSEAIPAMDMSDATVESIMNRIVTRGSGGIWVMYPVSRGWQSHPAEMPFTILSYSGDEVYLRQLSCTQRGGSK